MTDLGREQPKRDCADALDALRRTQSVDGVAVVADSLRALGPAAWRRLWLLVGKGAETSAWSACGRSG